MEASGLHEPELIINRVKIDMIKRGDMMAIDDVSEILALDVLGVVPDDENVIVASNRGEPAVFSGYSKTAEAYKNIARRILGDEVPFMNLEKGHGIFKRLKWAFKKPRAVRSGF